MNEPIRLAIIGTGLIVKGKHWPALEQLPGHFRVTALCNRSPAKAEALADAIGATTGQRPAVYTDYGQLLETAGVEAVSLAVPPVLNPEVAGAALAAGCHVIAEKPIAASLQGGARMIEDAARCGRVLMVAENYRYLASYRRAREIMAQGVIGQVRTARWSYYQHIAPENPYHQTAWRRRPLHPGGYVSDAGVHHVAVLRMLLGEVKSVTCQVTLGRADLAPIDTLAATLHFREGAMGSYAVTFAVPGPPTALEVAGTEGCLLAHRYRVELWQGGRAVESWELPSLADGLVEMYIDFASAVRQGTPPRAPAPQALEDLRVIQAMLLAAEAGRQVELDEVF